MTVNSTKIGPGVLSFETGTPRPFQAQCVACELQVTEVVASTDAVPVLSGETLAASDTATYTYALAVTFLQDEGQTVTAGIVGYSWANAGQTKPFTFTPSNAAAAGTKTWSGNCRIKPLNIGGKAGDNGQSDVVFAIIGTPTMA